MPSPNSEKSPPSHWPISILSSVAAILNMAIPLILVRILPKEDVGLFKIFFLYLMILPAFSMTSGVISGLAYWAGREAKKVRAIQLSSLSTLTAATLILIVTLIFSPVLSSQFGWSDQTSYLFAFSLFGAIASLFFEEAAIATGKVWTGAIFHTGFEFLRTFVVILTAFLTKDLYAIFLVHTVISVIKVAAGYAYGLKLNLIGFSYGKESDRALMKEIWKYAFPVSAAWIFGIFSKHADQFILSNYLTAADFAIYSIGCLSIPPLFILEQSITRVLIPQLSQYFDQDLPKKCASLYSSAIEQLSFLLVPASFGLAIFAEPIIHLLFTKEYSDAIPFLQWFAVSYILIVIPYDSIPRARAQGGWILKNFIFFSILSLILIYFLTLKYGAFGGLGGLLISRVLTKLYAVFYIKVNLSWKFSEFLPIGSFFRFNLICILLAIPTLYFKSSFESSNQWFLVGGTLFTLCYFISNFLWKNLRPDSSYRSQTKKKVLMVTQYLGIGGLEKMILNLSINLKYEDQRDVYVFAFDEEESESKKSLIPLFKRNEIPYLTYKKKDGFSLIAVIKLIKFLSKNEIQVIHSHDLGALIYSVFAKIFSAKYVKLIHTQHSFVHLQTAKKYELYEKIFTFFVDELTVVSEPLKKQYQKLGTPEKRITVIHNGVTFPSKPISNRERKIEIRRSFLSELPDQQRNELLPQIEKTWLLYIARVHPVKGQLHALETWNHLAPETREKCSLVFLGPDTDQNFTQKLNQRISESKTKEHIHYLGPTQESMSWLRSVDLYLLFSDFEGMPLGALEALGSGLPAVLSQIPAHEFLKEKSYQFLPPNYPDGAKVLTQALGDLTSTSLETLWKQSAWIRESFSLEEMTRRYSNLYDKN